MLKESISQEAPEDKKLNAERKGELQDKKTIVDESGSDWIVG
jgi:hypothetical protein